MSTALPLGSFSENANRLGLRIQETFTERITRDFGSSTAALFDAPDDKFTDIRKHLDSSSDREKLDALKRLIAMISKGRDVSEFFAQVVKNVASHNLEVRKLVYIYLLRYAESEPDLALLSINTFQKDLTDSSPLIRAMALRVLSGIRVPIIGSIVSLAIKKCAADVSPYVRKIAALAIPKCLSLDDSHRRELMTILISLLKERSPLAIGAVLVAFNAACADRLDLLHQHYRRLCALLADADEWGQVATLNTLVRYARRMLSRPLLRENAAGETVETLDADLQLLLNSAEPLFMSRNPAVVLAAARAIYYLGPPSRLNRVISPLLRLLHTSPEVERVMVEECYVIARNHPDLLSGVHPKFYIKSIDDTSTKLTKLRILVRIMNSGNSSALLNEFEEYVRDYDDAVAAAAVNAIGNCASQLPEYTSRCIEALMRLMRSSNDAVGSSAVRVLKQFVQANPSLSQQQNTDNMVSAWKSTEIVESLARQFDSIKHPRARACVLWLVGQYSEPVGDSSANVIPNMANWAPDVLRRVVQSFTNDTRIVKLQTLTLSAKLLLLAPEHEKIGKMSQYCFHLARYDEDYDVRDRGRMLCSLLADICPILREKITTEEDEPTTGQSQQGRITLRREQIRLILMEGKEPSHEEPDMLDPRMTLGSMALITGKCMTDSTRIPEWEEQGTEWSLRDSPDERPTAPLAAYSAPVERNPTQGFGNSPRGMSPMTSVPHAVSGTSTPVGAGSRWRDLDSFYDDEDNQHSPARSGDEEEEEDEEEGEEELESEEEEGEEESEEESGGSHKQQGLNPALH